MSCTRPVSRRGRNIGESFLFKAEKTRGHVLDYKIQSASESFERQIWDMADLSMNHEDLVVSTKRSSSESNSTIDLGLLFGNADFDLNDIGEADASTLEIESKDDFECFESIESPRADADAEHRAWLEQRNYRAWFAARNLHLQ
jgi:hypothetical protein